MLSVLSIVHDEKYYGPVILVEEWGQMTKELHIIHTYPLYIYTQSFTSHCMNTLSLTQIHIQFIRRSPEVKEKSATKWHMTIV